MAAMQGHADDAYAALDALLELVPDRVLRRRGDRARPRLEVPPLLRAAVRDRYRVPTRTEPERLSYSAQTAGQGRSPSVLEGRAGQMG